MWRMVHVACLVFEIRRHKLQCAQKKRKMSQKSAKSKNAHFPRKFITRWKWLNFGTMVDGHNGQKYQKNCEWPIFVTRLKFFWILNFDPKYRKSAPENFCDFWLNQPSRGWRTRVWPKTGTGSSFRRHFVGKTNFWVFLGIFSARC